MKTALEMVKADHPHMNESMCEMIAQHNVAFAGYLCGCILKLPTIGAVKQALQATAVEGITADKWLDEYCAKFSDDSRKTGLFQNKPPVSKKKARR